MITPLCSLFLPPQERLGGDSIQFPIGAEKEYFTHIDPLILFCYLCLSLDKLIWSYE